MIKKRKKIKIGILFMASLILYFSYVIIVQQKIIQDKNAELIETEQRIKEEQKVKEKLTEQLKTVHSDDYIEKTARQKLGLVKEGDRVFIDVNK